MMNSNIATTRQRLRTPRAAAVAGILFAVLFTVSMLLIRFTLPEELAGPNAADWLAGNTSLITLALTLVPFAGIAFLWFIGVIRDRIGAHEDRFFATVLLGSGLLFVAMLFVAAALALALRVEVSSAAGSVVTSDAWRVDARLTSLLMSIYAMRMAAVFTISVATIALRTGVIPKWLAYSGYASGLLLLVSVGLTPWIHLLFPLWILLLSVHILRRSWATPPRLREG